MKANKLLLWMSVLIALLINNAMWFLIGCNYGRRTSRGQEQAVVVMLPNQGQLQQILNAIEPGEAIRVDYCVGPATRDKWDRVCANAYAQPYFTPTGAPR